MTHENPDREARPPRRVRVLLDRAISTSAGIVALSALAVSMYQAWIAREQQKMSAWPYVTQTNTGAGGYSRLVQNVGLGPALVRSMRVEVDGRPVRDWPELLLAGFRQDSATLRARVVAARFSTSSVRPGMVLLPGSNTELVHVSEGEFADALRRLLNDERRLRIRICFCSLYGDCWLSDNRSLEPTEIRACPTPDAALEFRS